MRVLRPHFRMSIRWRRLTGAATLVMYILTTVGLPLNLTGGASHSGCQCSRELQSSQQCCCHKRTRATASGPDRSCCRSSRTVGHELTIDSESLCCSSKGELSIQELEKIGRPHSGSECRSKAAPRSCCSEKQRTTPRERPAGRLALKSCSCSGETVLGLLLNPEPRHVQTQAKLTIVSVDDTTTLGDADLPAEPCLLPETPPPEDQLALNLFV